jgi:MFS family permease
MGAAFALLFPSLALIVLEHVPEERRGAAMGTFTAFFDVGVGIGSPLAGAAAALGGYGISFAVAAVLGLGTIAVVARLRPGLARNRLEGGAL